ncbi:hypothetical protein TNCV_744401 [Trichonephila clavipes]|nr:hypothetical protein TNCV_744401 [Trichonephila clavipes]
MENGNSIGKKKAAKSVEQTTVRTIFNHDSKAKIICTFQTTCVDGRITTIPTAIISRCYEEFTEIGKRVDIVETSRIPGLKL